MTMTRQEIIVSHEPYHYDPHFPLLSIHLASNRPTQFTEFVANIHDQCSNKNAYEIFVKIDTEDQIMIDCVTQLTQKYGEDKIKAFIAPKKLGPWSAWESFNDMFRLTHPKTYFLWNPSDEVRIATPCWDLLLQEYIAFYPDHIFRLKLSDNRLRNFYTLDEVLRDPDNFPLITKKWMDICGVWGDCHSPDVFHQAVSFYLGKQNIFRDIPIFDLTLTGLETGLLVPSSQKMSRIFHVRRLWLIALSRRIRSRYLAHAHKLRFYLQSFQINAHTVTFNEDIRFPSRLECRNSRGIFENIVCRDQGIVTYVLKLRNEYLQPKILFLKSILFKKPLKMMFLSPIMTIVFFIALWMLFKNNLSFANKVVGIILLTISAWRLGFNAKYQGSILKAKIRF